jgi:cation:H+ antiporter
MLHALPRFLGFAALIVAGGILLARSTDRIADRTGLGHTLVGLVLLAVATSLPEFTVAYSSASIGAIDLTIGDVLGSSLINLLILAILDLLTRTGGRMFAPSAAAHALSATAALLLTSIVLLFLLLDLEWTIFGVGPGTIALVACYLAMLRLIALDQRLALARDQGRTVGHREQVRRPPLRACAVYVGGAAVIFLAGPPLVRSADEIAVASGIGRSFFGTLFVATVTSLPEIVTTIAALRLGRREMAIAKVFGSNAFNMLVPAVADLATDGPVFSIASEVHAITATAVILVTAVAMTCLLYRAERRVLLLEPDALLVVLLVAGAMVLVYLQSR